MQPMLLLRSLDFTSYLPCKLHTKVMFPSALTCSSWRDAR